MDACHGVVDVLARNRADAVRGEGETKGTVRGVLGFGALAAWAGVRPCRGRGAYHSMLGMLRRNKLV